MTIYEKDNPDYLRLSIDSMLGQTIITNDFVIVCDGPLTEDLEKVLSFYTSKHPFFNVVRLEKNEGLGSALQKGLLICKNNLVARMDDDDIAVSNRCELEINEFIKDESLDICGSFVYEFENDVTNKPRLKRMPLSNTEILDFSKRRNPFNHSTVMFKKERVVEIGNYKELRTNQDVELWVRGLNNGLKGINIPQPLVYFRFNSNTYQRRKDRKNIDLMISLWKGFYDSGFCSLKDYKSVRFKQRVLGALPIWAIKWIYNHLR